MSRRSTLAVAGLCLVALVVHHFAGAGWLGVSVATAASASMVTNAPTPPHLQGHRMASLPASPTPPPPPLPLAPPPRPLADVARPLADVAYPTNSVSRVRRINASSARHSAGNSSGGGPCRRRRLLHWNILDGGGQRLQGISDFIRGGDYDVVTLNELNGFDGRKLAALGRRCGLSHSKLLAKSAYHLGVLSRHPLRLVVAERGPEFAHGLLCVRVLDLTLCVTHFNPHDSRKRADEARKVLKHAHASVEAVRPFMLVGDLNTLSSLDRAAHESADLPVRIREGPYAAPLGRKFLNRARTAIDYTPMGVLLSTLHDVGVGGGHSVPTNINADRMHFATLRLDYCLADERLVAGCSSTNAKGSPADDRRAVHGARPQPSRQKRKVQATILRNEQTNTLSDHFPLLVEFELSAGEHVGGGKASGRTRT